MADQDGEKLKAEVSALQVEVRDLRAAVDRNTESIADVRDGFQRLRGEINGSLPRIEEKVDRLIDRQETERQYFEKVQIHERQIGALYGQVAKKADAEANREEHGRLWFALKVFFYGMLTALVGLLVSKLLS